ncbi:MAG TPA: transketolase C-terminal domain-containing protein [Micromonosporaceae bacterium]|jgi:transketolase
MRNQFVDTTTALLDEDPRTALVLADISTDQFRPAAAAHPDRVLNVGIREQLATGVAGGLALTGLRPIVHSIATFLVERPFEQLKISVTHQGSGVVLVSNGASYDYSTEGRTHHAPGDVALLDTLPGWTVHVPGHPDEVDTLLRHAVADGDSRVYVRLSEKQNAAGRAVTPGQMQRVREGGTGVVIAVGPMLDTVLTAVADLDVTVLYATTVRPFDNAALRAAVAAARADVVLVEPYLAGTSSAHVADALSEVPHRLLALGVTNTEVRHYGTIADHDRVHGLDTTGVRDRITHFLRP